MPRAFSPATAEQVLSVVGAIAAKPNADAAFVSQFCDLPQDRADLALALAVDLGFLCKQASKYSPVSPLCKFVQTPAAGQKAAILRIMLESYDPFILFRNGIDASGSA